jgi:hypothetical protein
MTSIFTYLDGLPWQPVFLFGLGWLVFLVTVLWCFPRRHSDTCPRCGGQWQRTPRGNLWHQCDNRNTLVKQ